MPTSEPNPPSSEKDFLVYSGNKIPRIIRLAWSVVFLFGIYYLSVNMWPNLLVWIEKVK